jgi:hypothetical protein
VNVHMQYMITLNLGFLKTIDVQCTGFVIGKRTKGAQ